VCAIAAEERSRQLDTSFSGIDHGANRSLRDGKHYLKGVDLTRAGFAHRSSMNDAAPLDLWAREHGYTEIELKFSRRIELF